jgi:hypothetical protein
LLKGVARKFLNSIRTEGPRRLLFFRGAEESTAILRWTAVDQSEVRTYIGLGDEVGVAP